MLLYTPGVKEWAWANYWLVWVNFILVIIIIIVLHFKKTSYPLNAILLGIFTLLESYAVGFVGTQRKKRETGPYWGSRRREKSRRGH